MTYINIVTEDIISEVVSEKIIRTITNFEVGQKIRRGGNIYIRDNLHRFVQAAKNFPFFILTDLDTSLCPLELISNWMPTGVTPPNQFIFRIVVREIEGWLMADRDALKEFTAFRGTLPAQTDLIGQPKEHLLTIAQRFKRSVKDELIEVRRGRIKRAPSYNACLVSFVVNYWCPERAANSSESLKRAIESLKALDALSA